MSLIPAATNFTIEKSINFSVVSTIAASASTSTTINQNGYSLCGIMFPAAMTGTSITFLASIDGINFHPVYNSAGAVTYTVAASRFVSINPLDLQGIIYLQIVSGSTEAAARTLTCALKGV